MTLRELGYLDGLAAPPRPPAEKWNNERIVLADGKSFNSITLFSDWLRRNKSTVLYHLRKGKTPDDIARHFGRMP